ncbi:hypothetical protein WCE37_00505 [Luteimonas sp. MJ250]|uniref:hypothetical protein n=1 Tax=Luteimonas sp. MJ250 TaxID=3129236 RepID=UPI0031BAEF5E
MKRHALFFATALAVASLGAAGLAAAQSAPATSATKATTATDDARTDAPRAAKGERPMRHGKGHSGHRGGHSMRGGIERMDTDEDGRISRAEFDAAKAAREQARAARIAQREKAGAGESPRGARAEHPARDGMERGPRMGFDFDAMDTNKDGYIVRSEVAAHRDHMQQQMRAKHAERFAEAFAAADLNKDGKLSRVEVDEKMPRLSKRFAWTDDNRDGFLSRAELEAGKRR